MRISRLALQNALSLCTLPLYLLARPFLRWLGQLHQGRSDAWVFGGHSGRLYADNAAAVHAEALARGRRAVWVASDPDLARDLRARGYAVLRRNSFRARLAIERASVLVYSHGITDLDHALFRFVIPRGLKVHLNHSLNLLKAGQMLRPKQARLSLAERTRRAEKLDPFDYLLASSECERQNFLKSLPGLDERIILGGGAHLDAFMAARGRPHARRIVYFPTFRESEAAESRVSAQIRALCENDQLARWLAREDFVLTIVRHVNAGATLQQGANAEGRIVFLGPAQVLETVLDSAALISDYSGMLCDYLALDKPTIFFAFDREDYLTQRNLYVDYDAFAFGPQVKSAEELIALLLSGRYRDLAPYEQKRRHWQAQFFPELAPHYAARSYETIARLLDTSRR